MRDIAVFLALIGSLPFILYRPWYGILVLAWLGYMNPHRLAYGFITNMPVVLIVVLTLLTGLLFAKKEERGTIPVTRETSVLIIFIIWMFITTNFAVYSDLAWLQWDKVWKIQVIIFLTMMLINNKERVNALVWTIVLSLGFYGVKGGIFTLMTGGGFRVQGPSGTFIAGNNEIGLAMLLTIPLMRYLQLSTDKKIIKTGLNVMIFLTLVSILGTHSRGALVGAVLMGFFLILKSRKKFFLLILGALFIAGTLKFAPEEWFARWDTIETYEQDKSAMGRINAWWMAYHLAEDRVLGGGFEAFKPGMFRLYAPFPDNVHDAHSIYFEVLGEQGFIGLTLFLTLWLFTWLSAQQVIKEAKKDKELTWLRDLNSMLQVCLIAYAAGGAFLGLAYFDLPYHFMALVVISKRLLVKYKKQKKEKNRDEIKNSNQPDIEANKFKLLQ